MAIKHHTAGSKGTYWPPYTAAEKRQMDADECRKPHSGHYVVAICAIASTGVRNASSISAATPSPVIASLVGRFMTFSSACSPSRGSHQGRAGAG